MTSEERKEFIKEIRDKVREYTIARFKPAILEAFDKTCELADAMEAIQEQGSVLTQLEKDLSAIDVKYCDTETEEKAE